MKPTNTKTMFTILCKYMDKLEKGEVSTSEVFAITKLVGQAHNLLNYELKRAALMISEEFAEQHRDIEINTVETLPGAGENLRLTEPDED